MSCPAQHGPAFAGGVISHFVIVLNKIFFRKEAVFIARKCPNTNKRTVYLDCLECAERDACRNRDKKAKHKPFGNKDANQEVCAPATERLHDNEQSANASEGAILLDSIPELVL